MSDVVPKIPGQVDPDSEAHLPPVAGARVIYQGPVAPHWLIEHTMGEVAVIDAFRARAMARLILLPPHDPQFRRNRERVNRDGTTERIEVEWVGLPEYESRS